MLTAYGKYDRISAMTDGCENENIPEQEEDCDESGKRSFRTFFLKPPIWFDIIVWAVTAASTGLAVSVACLEYRAEMWAFILYAFALIAFVASLYVFLTFGDIPKRMARNRNVRRFISDFGFRSYVVSICSSVLNALYAVFGTVIATITHSVWLGTLVWYHIVLACCRARVFFYVKRHGKDSDGDRVNIKAYTVSGAALIAMAIAVIPVILLVVFKRNSYTFFGGTLVYVCTLALYTVIKLCTAIAGRKKARASGNYSLRAIRNISFADALISVFALQAAMLVAMNDETLASTLNPVVGGSVSFFIAAMGITMMVKGIRALKSGSYNADGAQIKNI